MVGSYGFFETVLEGHFWLTFLDKTFGSSRTIKNALAKTIADITIFGQFEILLFMVWTNKLEKFSEPLSEKVNRDYLIVFKDSVIYWLPASIICFYYIPFKYRVLYSCLSSLIWDTFMSYAAHNKLIR